MGIISRQYVNVFQSLVIKHAGSIYEVTISVRMLNSLRSNYKFILATCTFPNTFFRLHYIEHITRWRDDMNIIVE